MSKSVWILFLGVLLFTMMGGALAVGAASASTPQERLLPQEQLLPAPPPKSTAIPGEYLVLFKARESVLTLEGPARAGAVAMMLEMQAEHLSMAYGVTVVSTYSAISESSGKGMFFVRSEKAAEDPEFDKKLLEEMRADPTIEGVSPNEARQMISRPLTESKP